MAPPPEHYLREWREHRGLSVHAAASMIGISHAQLSRIERGAQQWRQGIVERAAIVYDVALSDLLFHPPPKRVNHLL